MGPLASLQPPSSSACPQRHRDRLELRSGPPTACSSAPSSSPCVAQLAERLEVGGGQLSNFLCAAAVACCEPPACHLPRGC